MCPALCRHPHLHVDKHPTCKEVRYSALFTFGYLSKMSCLAIPRPTGIPNTHVPPNKQRGLQPSLSSLVSMHPHSRSGMCVHCTSTLLRPECCSVQRSCAELVSATVSQPIEALQRCHREHPYAKFWGTCNEFKYALDRCFAAEKTANRCLLLL